MPPGPELPRDLAAAIVDAAPDALVVVDRHGTIVAANRRAEDLFGHPVGDLVGRPVEDLVPLESRDAHVQHREAYLAAPRQRPLGIGMTLHARHRDGHELPVEIALSPLEVDGETRVVAAVRDVSERTRIEAELHRAVKELAATAERERIARDLHDTVIQHLFAVGVSLQAVEQRASDPELAERIRWVTANLEQVIDEVRHAIFGPVTSLHALGDLAAARPARDDGAPRPGRG